MTDQPGAPQPSQTQQPHDAPPGFNWYKTLEDMHNTISHLQHEVRSLREEKHPQPTRMPKLAPPPAFSGKTADAESFKNACNLYMSGRSGEFLGDKSQIIWVLSYMQGELAVSFRDNLYDSTGGNFDGMSIEEFWIDFDANFEDVDKESTQVHSVRTIWMENRTAEEHVAAFKKAAHGSGYTGRPLVDEFKRSLHPRIREKLSNAEKSPKTISEWYSRAIVMDRQWRQTKAEEELYKHPGQMPKQIPKQQQPRPQWQTPSIPKLQTLQPPAKQVIEPVPMDVDRSKRGPLICFKCKRPGHMARDCRSRLDVRNMSYEEIMEYAKEQVAKKDFPKGEQ